MDIETINEILQQLGIGNNDMDYEILYDQFYKLRVHTELTLYLIFLLLFLFVITTIYFSFKLRRLEKLLKSKEDTDYADKN